MRITLGCLNTVNSILGLVPGRVWIVSDMWEELVARLIPDSDWESLNTATYNLGRPFTSKTFNRSLMFWEKDAFDRYFPAAPARVLVTAAGGGREVNELLARGYTVCAFEPALGLSLLCEEIARHDSEFTFTRLGYDQFTAETGVPFEGLFDAVVVGWGSFGHLPNQHMMTQLLSKLRKMCPAGPILLSWLPALELGRFRKWFSHLLGVLGATTSSLYSSRDGLFYLLNQEIVTQMAHAQGDKFVQLTKFKSTEAGMLLHQGVDI